MDRVLIAGAGPVGLAAANVLADAGVPVTVLEAEPRLPENLRASTFQPPTLDLLAPAVSRPRGLGRGTRLRRHCEQFKPNQVLAERLSSLPGAQLEFSAEVGDVRQNEDSGTVSVGRSRSIEARG
jgi:3-(3-hydroxy-phenyl)propionate hydroxylase